MVTQNKYEVKTWATITGLENWMMIYSGNSLVTALKTVYQEKRRGGTYIQFLWRP